jgi:[ribosomal protein S5]-alanine N-acetyltransferase
VNCFFETERLLVRAISPNDLEAFAALCADPLAMQYMGDGATLDHDTVRRWIDICQTKYQERGYGTSAVVEKVSEKFIGFCGVVRAPENDFDEIVYAISRDYWGKGYATEAAAAMLDYVFRISDLSEIYATIYAQNIASLKMMDKLNMAYVKSVTEADGAQTEYYVIRRGL